MLKAKPESVSGLFLCTMIYLYFHNCSLIFNLSLSLIPICLQIWTDSLWGNDKIFGFILAFILPRSTLDSNSVSFGPGPPLLSYPCLPFLWEFAFSSSSSCYSLNIAFYVIYSPDTNESFQVICKCSFSFIIGSREVKDILKRNNIVFKIP